MQRPARKLAAMARTLAAVPQNRFIRQIASGDEHDARVRVLKGLLTSAVEADGEPAHVAGYFGLARHVQLRVIPCSMCAVMSSRTHGRENRAIRKTGKAPPQVAVAVFLRRQCPDGSLPSIA
jgi:hypothetical protein